MSDDDSRPIEPFDSHELFRLFGAFSDGTISAPDHARLQELLRGHAEARQLWFIYNDIDTGLHAFARSAKQRGPGIPLPLQAKVAARDARRTPSLRAQRAAWLTRMIAAGAIAVVCAICAWMYLAPSPRTRPLATATRRAESQASASGESVKANEEAPAAGHSAALAPEGVLVSPPAPVVNEATSRAVAVLKGAVDVEWPRARDARPIGVLLDPGWVKLTSGLVKIELFSGACLLVEGPAEINLVSNSDVYFRSGRLTADVPSQVQDFKIETPQATFVGSGSKWGLDITRTTAEVHVFEGGLQICNSNMPIRKLNKGSATLMDHGRETQSLANPTKFVTFEEMNNRSEISTQRLKSSWQNAGRRMNADPALLFRYDFESSNAKARVLPNLATGKKRVEDGTIIGCDWSEGRWPGKGALEFRSLSDLVRVNVPGERGSITLSAWICVFGLDRQFNSLFMSDAWNPGAVHWQIVNDGHIRFSVKLQKEAYFDIDSPIVITPERMGKWVHVAVTFDTERNDVRHYFNGEIVRRMPIPPGTKVEIKSAEIGNWNSGVTGRSAQIRHFGGRIDEMFLYDRVLTPEEIAAQSRNEFDPGKLE